MQSDTALVRAFVERGDRASLGELVRRHQDEAYDVARRVVGDPHLAEDAVQEAFVRLIRSAGSWRATGSFAAWMFRIVVNCARDLHRRRGRAERAVGGHAIEPAAPADPPDRSAAAAEVRAAVDGLPEEFQLPVVLHFWRGLSHDEVAEALDVPRGTVASRIHRAKERLRVTLAGGTALAAGLDAALAAPLPPAAAPAALTTRLAAVAAGSATRLPAWATIGAAAALFALVGGGGWWMLGTRAGAVLPVAGAPAPSAAGARAALPANDELPSATVADSPAVPAAPAASSTTPPAGANDPATVLVRVTWRRDGSPAAGIGVYLLSWDGDEDSRWGAHEGVTGSDGGVRFTGVPPGTSTAYLDRGNGGSISLARGESATLEIALDDGVTVRGKVVDRHGNPVAGAGLRMGGSYETGVLMGHSDGAGQFEIPGVHYGFLRAERAGDCPSDVVQIGRPRELVQPLTLVLPGPGGALAGRVLDADRRPVPGAVVRTTEVPRGVAGQRLSPWRTCTTDPDGRFVVEGVRPGPVTLEVRSRRHALWHDRVEVEPDAATNVDIVLGPGATIEGSVRGADREPIAKALVFVSSGDAWGWKLSVRTGLDGRYRLSGLPAGTASIAVSARGVGRAERRTGLAASGTERWDVILDGGSVLRGRLEDEAGGALTG